MTKSNVVVVVVVGVSFYSVDSVHHPGKLEQELEAGTRKQELMQKLWRNTTHCLVPPGLLSLFSYIPRTTCQGMHHPQWAVPSLISHQLSSRKYSKDILTGQFYKGFFFFFPIGGSFLSNDFDLHQVDRN